jgi:hypothetical protein
MKRFHHLTVSGLATISPAATDTPLGAVESALGGMLDTVFIISSPTGEAGDLVCYGLAEEPAEGVPLIVILPSGYVVGARGSLVFTATAPDGSERSLSDAELACLKIEYSDARVVVTVEAAS